MFVLKAKFPCCMQRQQHLKINCFQFEPAVKIPLDCLSCVFVLTVCVVTNVSPWLSGLEEGQVSQRRSTIPSLLDEETSCKIDVAFKVTGSSLGACSDQRSAAGHVQVCQTLL